MGNSKSRRWLRRPSHGTVIAYLALFVALATGSAWAAATVGSNDIKNNAIKSRHIDSRQVHGPDIGTNAVGSAKLANDSTPRALKGIDVADESLTGTDVQNSSLSNADTDGSVQDSCTLGAVVGHALVDGASVGAAYGSAGVAERFNCGGANAVAKRNAAGDYNVCFPSSFPRVVLVSTITNGTAGKEDNIISWRRVNDAQCTGNVAVNVRVRDNGGTLEDSSFTALLLDT